MKTNQPKPPDQEDHQPDQELLDQIGDIHRVGRLLKSKFVGKDQLIDMMTVCVIAQEHLLIVGPPGTAKSELIKRFALLCCDQEQTASNGITPYFEYLLTRFTEPNEIFGPVNVKAFREGRGQHRLTDRYLPKAEIAFLDEVFKSNSAILNALLNVLNERVFYNGGEPQVVPLICAIGATNEIPDDTTLAALYDRFLVRLWTDNVDEHRFGELMAAGWALEKDRIQEGYKMKAAAMINTQVLKDVHSALEQVELEPIFDHYREVIRQIRSEGIEVSDRRAVKLLKLIGSATLFRKSLKANTGDFWVLNHVWNNPEQIPHLQLIIQPYLEGHANGHADTEPDLDEIDGALNVCESEIKDLRTDAEYQVFLQELHKLSEKLAQHRDVDNARPRLKRVDELTSAALKRLEELD